MTHRQECPIGATCNLQDAASIVGLIQQGYELAGAECDEHEQAVRALLDDPEYQYYIGSELYARAARERLASLGYDPSIPQLGGPEAFLPPEDAQGEREEGASERTARGRMGTMHYREVLGALSRLGAVVDASRGKGSHCQVRLNDRRVTLSYRPGEALGGALVRQLLRQLGVSLEDFMNTL